MRLSLLRGLGAAKGFRWGDLLANKCIDKRNKEACLQLPILSKFASMRGDDRASKSISKISAQFNHNLISDVELDKKVNDVAKKYYDKMENKRLSMNLDKFSNDKLM